MSRLHLPFLFIVAGAAALSLFLLISWMPPLLIVIGNAFLFTVLSFRIGKFYWPSGLIALGLIAFLIYAALVPWVWAIYSHTPDEHLVVAKLHEASWRFPLGCERAALGHYKIAAEAGIHEAECTVGMAYLYRHYGQRFDRERARFWLERAAAGGDISAQRQLSFITTVPGT